jgi:hypothetical protein
MTDPEVALLSKSVWQDIVLATLVLLGLGFLLILLLARSWGLVGAATVLVGGCAAAGVLVGGDNGPRSAFLTGSVTALVVGAVLVGRLIGGTIIPWYLAAAAVAGALGAAGTTICRAVAIRRAAMGRALRPESLRACASAVIVALFLAAAPMAVSQPVVSWFSTMLRPRGPAGWRPIFEFWSGVEGVGDLADCFMTELGFSIDASSGRITQWGCRFLVRDETQATIYYTSSGVNGMRGGPERWRLLPYAGRVFLDASVSLADLRREFEALDTKALTGSAKLDASGDLNVMNQDGVIIGLHYRGAPVCLVERGQVRALEPGQLAVASGRIVQTQLWNAGPSGALPGPILLFPALSGPVELIPAESVNRWKPPGADILDARVVDADGDGDKEAIYLACAPRSPEKSVRDTCWLTIIYGGDVTGAGGQSTAAKDYALPGEPIELTVRDVTGDGKPEFLIRSINRGDVDISLLSIYTLKGGRLTPLFRSADRMPADFRSEYVGNGVVRVRIPSLDVAWEWRAYPWADSDALMRERFPTNRADPSGFDFADIDGDGAVEIVARAFVGGVNVGSYEAAGTIHQVFAWDGTTFALEDAGLYDRDGNLIERRGQ